MLMSTPDVQDMSMLCYPAMQYMNPDQIKAIYKGHSWFWFHSFQVDHRDNMNTTDDFIAFHFQLGLTQKDIVFTLASKHNIIISERDLRIYKNNCVVPFHLQSDLSDWAPLYIGHLSTLGTFSILKPHILYYILKIRSNFIF